MKNIISILLAGILIMALSAACKKQNEGAACLMKFANELNDAPDKELSNGTILTGCEYAEGDSSFTYIIKVPDNRFDKMETDSIKRYFAKNVQSDGMSKIVRLLDKANVGLCYRLELPEKEVSVDFHHSEIAEIVGKHSK